MTVTITQTDDLEHCHALRRAVFIDEQGVSEAEELDDLDPVAVHFLAWVEDRAVGTARVILRGEVAKIGRVCVLSACRGQGVGAALIRHTVDWARREPGITQAKLGAQIQALGFYEGLGFVPVGPVYLDAGIEHREMTLRL